MAKIFYLSEIVKFAIEKEIESEELYTKLAEKSQVAALKNLFSLLVQEEKKHEAIYRAMLGSITEEQTPGIKEGSEYFDYMQELINASRTVVPLSNEQLNNTKVAIDFAIAREKDSILFYIGLKNFVLPEDHSKLDTIIKEEGRHIALLTKLRKDF